ncbi:MAG: DNA-packaging protein [Proteobacteria bacterium]|nr:DNA-packaging protein [Pseudomonadota bacterium]
MDAWERGIRRRLKAEFPHYAEKCLKIRTKQGAIAPFILNRAQQFIHTCLEEQKKTTGKVRALILKGRQQGCSTYVEARFYWQVTHQRGARAFILTHLDDATRNIYQIMRRFHDYCPVAVKPHASHANSRELVFDRLDSGYQVGTAHSQGVGRSNTVQYFHGSEVAYWANAEEHVSGVLQAVPDMAGTEVILESTAAGAQGLFYTLCAAAQQRRSEYRLIFVPWFWQAEYRKTLPEDFAASDEEKAYQREFGLDEAQICWRRTKIAELGNIWTFRREYPASAEEAFRSDHPGAFWTREIIHGNRRHKDDMPEMKRIVVAVDPATTSDRYSDETGIIVAGLGIDDHGYVMADLSGKYAPAQWATIVVAACYKYQADRVVAEVNQGGDMVEHTLRTFDTQISYKSVHASRGKIARAEPIAALDAQGRIHHVGMFGALEDQMCRFNPAAGGASPDRVDARIWALTELMLNKPPSAGPCLWGG